MGENVKVAGVPISAKGTTTSRKERMKFVSVEDHTGVIEVVLFPDAYRRWGHALTGEMLVFTGRIIEDETALTLEATSVEALV